MRSRGGYGTHTHTHKEHKRAHVDKERKRDVGAAKERKKRKKKTKIKRKEKERKGPSAHQVNAPLPCIMPSLKSPMYRFPLVNVAVPWPQYLHTNVGAYIQGQSAMAVREAREGGGVGDERGMVGNGRKWQASGPRRPRIV